MKVCLITYSRSNNYGAALQLFATYRYLERMGCQVDILNYQNVFEASKDGNGLLSISVSIKDAIRWFISGHIFRSIKNAKQNFSKFYNSMNYTAQVSSIKQIESWKDYDLFVVGSDQVWNPNLTNGFDHVFCLKSDKIKRKISYASSMGSLDFKNFDTKVLFEGLSSFTSLSVREKIAQEYLERNVRKNISIVIDPTMLFDRKEWNQLLQLDKVKNPIPEKYVLIYALGGEFDKNNSVARQVADILNIKTAVVTLSNRPKNVDYLMNNITPNQFVKLVNDAEFIVTNSFHGTCFSILFEKPFYSVKYGLNPKRTEELLNRYQLQRRIFSEGDEVDKSLINNMDVKSSSKMIAAFRAESQQWFEEAVWGDNNG